jgi:hypothetical protein
MERVRKTAERVGRNPDDITIVAVTKFVPLQKIEEAIVCGIKIIGENRVQEAKKKYEIVGNRVVWHMVGHLQTNKVKDALNIFSLIHSLDSLKLAQEIEKRAVQSVDCLVEVNTSKEESKYGITPNKVFGFFDNLRHYSKINVLGLMTIGPGWALQDSEASRSCFHLLHDLRDELIHKLERPLPYLSMGMTSDFEVAIEEGATIIRIGTAIFGQRR